MAPRRLLAVDFGERRVGLAISDPEGRLAVPLTTLRRRNDAQIAREIGEIATREAVDELVVGEPRRLDGTVGEAAQRVQTFATRLARVTGLPCTLVDEALSSREAAARLRQAGVDPRRHPERVDQLAAQILLEDVLSRRRPR